MSLNHLVGEQLRTEYAQVARLLQFRRPDFEVDHNALRDWNSMLVLLKE
jgi:hypothetical protein